MFSSTLVRLGRQRRRILLLLCQLLFVESTLCSATLAEIPSAWSNTALSPTHDFSPALARNKAEKKKTSNLYKYHYPFSLQSKCLFKVQESFYFRLLVSSCCYRNHSLHPSASQRQETELKCATVSLMSAEPSCSLRVSTSPHSTPQSITARQRCKHPLAIALNKR